MSYNAKRFKVIRFLFVFILFSCFSDLAAQDDVNEDLLRYYLQYNKCNFEKSDIVVLSDENSLRFNANFELELRRTVFLKFLTATTFNESIQEVLFYHDKSLEQLDLTRAKIYYQDPQLLVVTKDVAQKFLSNTKPNFEKGQVLEISYSIKYFYTRKMPLIRVQHIFPTEKLGYNFFFPDLVKIEFQIPDKLTADVDKLISGKGVFKINGIDQTIPFNDKQLSFSQIQSISTESFVPYLYDFSQKIGFNILELKRFPGQSRGESIKGDFGQSVIEQVHKRNNIMPKLLTKYELPKAYDYRLRSIQNQEEKLGRIFDLVRRNFRWNGVDSLFVDGRKTIESIWNERKCTGSEINITLIKLLMNYGFEAYPMLVSTRKHGSINQEYAELKDFNRVIAVVYIKDRVIPLDATQTFGDFPILSLDVLNTWGLSMAMSPDRWFLLDDTANRYYNNTLLLGTYLNDGVFRTNAYVNSFSHSKAIRVASLERDSIKHYIKRNFTSPYSVKHFIVANEYVDSLPLAQEFDIDIPVSKANDLREVNVNFAYIPDTLKSILESRTIPLDFGYMQRYELKGEFSFPSEYQIYLLPGQTNLAILNGDVTYTRNYHGTSQSFSYVSSLVFKKSSYSMVETKEIAAFIKKIANYQLQNVIIRKVN